MVTIESAYMEPKDKVPLTSALPNQTSEVVKPLWFKQVRKHHGLALPF